MKFNLEINQKAVVSSGLPLDVTDAHIFYFLMYIINNIKFVKVWNNEKQYTFFHWGLIPEQLPILGITTRQSVTARINRLISLGLIEKFVKKQRLYICLGANANLLQFEKEE